MKSLISKIKKQFGRVYPPTCLSARQEHGRRKKTLSNRVCLATCPPQSARGGRRWKHGRRNEALRSRGIALVEVIAALGIAVVVITALVSLSIFTLRSSLRSKLMLEGTKIANRELELVRAYRDTNTWDDFTDGVILCEDSDCSMDLSGTIVNYSSSVQGTGVETITRSFTVNFISSDMVRINVTVTWNIGSDVKGAYLYTDLTNWRSR